MNSSRVSSSYHVVARSRSGSRILQRGDSKRRWEGNKLHACRCINKMKEKKSKRTLLQKERERERERSEDSPCGAAWWQWPFASQTYSQACRWSPVEIKKKQVFLTMCILFVFFYHVSAPLSKFRISRINRLSFIIFFVSTIETNQDGTKWNSESRLIREIQWYEIYQVQHMSQHSQPPNRNQISYVVHSQSFSKSKKIFQDD